MGSSSKAPPAQEAPRRLAAELQLRLMAAVAGLDRGLSAKPSEVAEVEDLAKQLEVLGGVVVLGGLAVATDGSYTPSQFAGNWRLVYTSGFNSGSLGGQRPGPPAWLVPVKLGQVYQRVDELKGKLDNIVEFLPPPLPFSPPAPRGDGGAAPRGPPALRVTLGHDYQVEGTSTVRIVFEDTQAEVLGGGMLGKLPKFSSLPVPDWLKPPRGLRSATFEVTFLDKSVRITRGDRGELRIYTKDA